MFHRTIKFTVEYSKEGGNRLVLNKKIVDMKLRTIVFVKPKDTHQFLDPTSSHPYHCKKGIAYSQALGRKLDRFCPQSLS